MEERILSADQLQRLIDHKRKAERAILGKTIILPLIFMIFAAIPTKYLAFLKIFSKRGTGARLDDSSLIDSMGFSVLFYALAFYLLSVLIMAFTYNYLNLRKDVKSGNYKMLDVTIEEIKVIKDFGNNYYDLYFTPSTDGKRKVRFFEAHPYFHILRPGQKVMLQVSEFSFYPIAIYPGGV